MELKEHSTVTTKGQVTIPKAVRDELDLRAGDRITWSVRGDGAIEVRKESTQTLEALVGMLGKPSRSLTVAELDEAVAARHRARRG